MKLMANDYSTIHNIGQNLKSAGKNFAMAATIGVCAYGVLEGAYRAENAVKYFDYKNFKNIIINLKGRVQVQNACLCIEVFKIFILKSWYGSK